MKKGRVDLTEKIQALHSDLKKCEEQLESMERKDKPNSSSDANITKLQANLKEKRWKIEQFKTLPPPPGQLVLLSMACHAEGSDVVKRL